MAVLLHGGPRSRTNIMSRECPFPCDSDVDMLFPERGQGSGITRGRACAGSSGSTPRSPPHRTSPVPGCSPCHVRAARRDRPGRRVLVRPRTHKAGHECWPTRRMQLGKAQSAGQSRCTGSRVLPVKLLSESKVSPIQGYKGSRLGGSDARVRGEVRT